MWWFNTGLTLFNHHTHTHIYMANMHKTYIYMLGKWHGSAKFVAHWDKISAAQRDKASQKRQRH